MNLKRRLIVTISPFYRSFIYLFVCITMVLLQRVTNVLAMLYIKWIGNSLNLILNRYIPYKRILVRLCSSYYLYYLMTARLDDYIRTCSTPIMGSIEAILTCYILRLIYYNTLIDTRKEWVCATCLRFNLCNSARVILSF